MDPVASIADPKVAAHLLDPLRARILELARDAQSASQLAEHLGLQRQRVNYHVKQLREAGLLVEAGRREKRNLTEVLYAASAARYLIDPLALGPLAPDSATQGVLLLFDREVRFSDPALEKAFGIDMREKITEVVDGASGQGRTFRMMAWCYQRPQKP